MSGTASAKHWRNNNPKLATPDVLFSRRQRKTWDVPLKGLLTTIVFGTKLKLSH